MDCCRKEAVWLVAAALAVRLAVLALTYAAPAALALRNYGPDRRGCASLRQLATRRPDCAVLAEDEIGYDALGRSVAAGRGLVLDQNWVIAQAGTPTAYGGLLYPAFVGAVYAATHDDALALFLIQALLGAVAVAGVAFATFRLADRRAALTAGALAAIHPGLALNSAWVMSEALAVPLLLGAYLLWVRYLELPTTARACAFGAAAAAASLTRSPAAVALVAMVALSLPRRDFAWRLHARRLGAALLVFAACVAPWAARNARAFHAFVPLDTKAGANLWLTNHPSPHPWREVWTGRPDPRPAPQPITGVDEARTGRYFGRLAASYVEDQPLTFAGVSALRLGLAMVPVPRWWGRWPAARAAAAAFYVALTWLALAGLWKVRRQAEGRALIGVAGGWLLMMAVTAVGLRHRLAAEWAFTMAAGLALAALRLPRPASAPPPPPR